MRVDRRNFYGFLMGLICASGLSLLSCAPASSQDASSKEDSSTETFSKETTSKENPKAVVLKAVAGERIELACETNAVGMDFSPFKVSKGILRIVLSFKQKVPGKDNSGEAGSTGSQVPSNSQDMSDPAVIGTWTSSIAPGEHEASSGVFTQKLCKDGCVLRTTPEGNMELWAPGLVMPSKLKDDETLTLASLDATTLELKATAFRGKKLSVLEKGSCKISKP